MTDATSTLDGLILWNQRHCKDVEAQLAFYNGLFGWTSKAEERETYIHMYQGEKTVAGVMPTHEGDEAPPHWSVLVGTDDTELGAAIHVPPTEIPKVGGFAVLGDPEGAMFALYRMNPR